MGRLTAWIAQAMILAGMLAATSASAQDDGANGQACGNRPLAIARMAWPSAEILAEIHALILSQEFGCSVQVVPGDLAATASSMASSGQPAIAPEMWIARIADIWNSGIRARAVRQAGQTFTGQNLEGWFVPDYVALAHPELTSAANLKENWQIFAGTRPKAQLISCPPQWACAVINRNLLKALGLQEHFELIEPKDRFELDTLIAGAVSRREPIVFYYWQPNAVLDQFAFKPLDMGTYDREAFMCLGDRNCAGNKPSAFAPEPVVIAASEWVFTDLPQIAAYLSRAAMPVEEMNGLLGRLNNDGANAQIIAQAFVAEKQALWSKWVSPAAP